jgi:hypothetical protein
MSLKPVTVYQSSGNNGFGTTYRIRGNVPLFYFNVTKISHDGYITVELPKTATIHEAVDTLCSVLISSDFVQQVLPLGSNFKGIKATVDDYPFVVNYANCYRPYEIKHNWRARIPT